MNSFFCNQATGKKIEKLLTDLNGYPPPFSNFENLENLDIIQSVDEEIEINFNRFNELQLSFGYSPVSIEFYSYLYENHRFFSLLNEDCVTYYDKISDLFVDIFTENNYDYFEKTFTSIGQLENAINFFRIHALLVFGNVKNGFTVFSTNNNELEKYLSLFSPVDDIQYTTRLKPLHSIEKIAGEDTCYLGYLIQKEIDQRIKNDPNDSFALKEKAREEQIKKIGEKNYRSYLATAIFDVYIATSMRTREEYYTVSKWVDKIFTYQPLAKLNPIWFDPTQSYCHNRIDKGLFEALMLRKAQCTVYFVQENDSLGKDSELASTLAQGKPVIAYVPYVDDTFVDNLINEIQSFTDQPKETIVFEKLKEINPKLAWENESVINWIKTPNKINCVEAKKLLKEQLQKHYDSRYEILTKNHPLGMQVNLSNGVANGVLVVRSLEDCSRLLTKVLKNTLEYDLIDEDSDTCPYLHLREKISNCIYRVATKDIVLTNTFWSYYIM